MLAVAPPEPVSTAALARLSDQVEAMMTSVQAEGLSAVAPDAWARVEPALAAVLDAAIVSVPAVARRLVAAFQRLGWLLRSGQLGDAADDAAVDDLETVLECLLAFAEGLPVAEDRSPAELLGWLGETLGVSQAAVAALVGVSLRTLQRWLRGEARPGVEEGALVRRLAGVVNEARFALTPDGVMAWLARPTPYLGGRTPLDAVRATEPRAGSALERLTATLRYG